MHIFHKAKPMVLPAILALLIPRAVADLIPEAGEPSMYSTPAADVPAVPLAVGGVPATRVIYLNDDLAPGRAISVSTPDYQKLAQRFQPACPPQPIPTCNLDAYQISVTLSGEGSGGIICSIHYVDIVTGLVGDQVPGTQCTFSSIPADGGLHILVCEPTASVPLPCLDSLYVVIEPTIASSPISWMLARLPEIGEPANGAAYNTNSQAWESIVLDEDHDSQIDNGFAMAIRCIDPVPVPGACCIDSVSVCRDGVSVGECRDHGGRWAAQMSCASNPFTPPCGAAACCTPVEDSPSAPGNCQDELQSECDALDGLWQFQRDLFCGDDGQFCPPGACIAATQPCTEENNSAPGCADESCCSLVCAMDAFCCTTVWDNTCTANALQNCPSASHGTCCFPEGVCAESVQTTLCSGLGGTPSGTDPCAQTTCPPPLGACCVVGQPCTLTSSADCSTIGATWGGPLTNCSDANVDGIADICQPPTGACVTECGACVMTATCDWDCTPPECGDGLLNTATSEQCDDGNTANCDGCSGTCRNEACGNGVVECTEQCDDGNTANCDGCSGTCRNEACGNGVVECTEQCDDGNNNNCDGCHSICQIVDITCTQLVHCSCDYENNACNHAGCTFPTCAYTCIKYGDVKFPQNNIVNLDDILCVLASFSNPANCPDADIAPCGGNGIFNLDDILSVLAAFSGANPCNCDPAGAAPLCGSSQP